MCFGIVTCTHIGGSDPKTKSNVYNNQISVGLPEKSEFSSSVISNQPRNPEPDFGLERKSSGENDSPHDCAPFSLESPITASCNSTASSRSLISESESSFVSTSVFTYDKDMVTDYNKYLESKAKLPALPEDINSPTSDSDHLQPSSPIVTDPSRPTNQHLLDINENLDFPASTLSLSSDITLENAASPSNGKLATTECPPTTTPLSESLSPEEEDEKIFNQSPKLVTRTKRLAIKRRSTSAAPNPSASDVKQGEPAQRSHSLRAAAAPVNMRRNSPR